MWIQNGDNASVYGGGFHWGDFYSGVTADGYRTTILSRSSENNAGTTQFVQTNMAMSTAVAGHFTQRTYDGSGASIAIWKGANLVPGPASVVEMLGLIAYPNLAGATFGILPLLLGETTPFVRGRYRGIWWSPHTFASVNDGDTLNGTGNLAGKSFRVIKGITTTTFMLVETSDTWDTSS
jgi:hypothetical protein